jgi:hypothetical protein
MAERNTYYANRLFTGSKWLNQYVVVTERGAIIDILPATAIHEPYTAQFSLMAPAFMDIQIYGAYDRLLAVYPEVTSLVYTSIVKKGVLLIFNPPLPLIVTRYSKNVLMPFVLTNKWVVKAVLVCMLKALGSIR